MESWPAEPQRPRRKLRGHLRKRSGTYPCDMDIPLCQSNQPVDVDEVSASPFECGVNNITTDCRVSKSVPDESELDAFRGCIADRERMLCQLGMDVSRENSYCAVGKCSNPSARRKSLDCNYQVPLETAYEDFGVERKLVELRPTITDSEKESSNKTGKRLRKIKSRARTSLGGNRAPLKGTTSEEVKTKVLSLIRGKQPKHSTGTPNSAAVVSCEDQMTEKSTYDHSSDTGVLSNRRVPQVAIGLQKPTPFDARSRIQRKEVVMSSFSSCGDTTVKWGNCGRERIKRSSGISI